MLLDRRELPAIEAIEHLVGLQAQEPQEPYVGVWSRLSGFVPSQLSGLLMRRSCCATSRQAAFLADGDPVGEVRIASP